MAFTDPKSVVNSAAVDRPLSDQKTWSDGGPVAQLAALNNLSPASSVKLSYCQHASRNVFSTPKIDVFWPYHTLPQT